jgi:hypothetical protein
VIVVSLFDYTTNMVQPWAEAGHTCYCVDIQHPPGITETGNVLRVGANVHHWLPLDRPDIVLAFPPCTDVAVSGARWMADKGLGKLIDALSLFKRAVDLAECWGCPYMLENPVSTVSTYWRKPDHTFEPWHYGDMYTKKTCLWTGNGFVMPEPIYRTRPADVDTKRIHHASPGPERANFRSETPMGFARAVFHANARSTASLLTTQEAP